MVRLLVFACVLGLLVGSAQSQPIEEIRTYDLRLPDFDGVPNFGDTRIHDLHAISDEWIGGAEFGSGPNIYYTTGATPISCPNNGGSSLQSINQWRSIVGSCGNNGVLSAFVRSPSGVYTFIMPPGGTLSLGNGHNNKEIVVGSWRNGDPNVSFLPFVWNRKTNQFLPFTLPIPGVTATVLHAINNNATAKVVGIVTLNGGGWQGFVVNNPPTLASLTMINVPGAMETYPFDINDHGHVAGVYVNDQGQWLPFLWYNGQFYTINVPNTIATDITSITNDGRIAGTYVTTEGIAQIPVTKGYIYKNFPWIPLTSSLTAVMARQSAPAMMMLQAETVSPDTTAPPLCQPNIGRPSKLAGLASVLCK